MFKNEYGVGLNQVFVIYVSDDTGSEVDPTALYGQIAGDAAQRAQMGLRLISMAAVPLRHSAAFLAREGSGYETKVAVAVVYAP